MKGLPKELINYKTRFNIFVILFFDFILFQIVYSSTTTSTFASSNFEKEFNSNLAKNIQLDTQFTENPCYLKGYMNSTLHMIGTGDYPKCHEALSKLINITNIDLEFNITQSNSTKLKGGDKSIILGTEFKEVYQYITYDKISFANLTQAAQKACSETKISSTNTKICFRLTYTIIVLEKLFNPTKNAQIIFSANVKDKNQSYLINRVFFKFEQVPFWYIFTLFVLLVCYIFSYLYKSELAKLIQKRFFKETLERDNDIKTEKSLRLIESTITSLPVENFLFSKLKDEIKMFTQKEVFVTLSEYKIFFYKMFKKHYSLRMKVEETIQKRNNLKAGMVMSIIQISLAIFLSILTTKIISYMIFNVKNFERFLLVTSSFVYMSFTIIECLRLITILDNMKFLNSKSLNNYEKKILEEEDENLKENNFSNEI